MGARRASTKARRWVLHRWGCGLLVLASAWVLSACAGDGPPPVPATSSFDAIQQTIFTPHCLFAGCHNATDQAGNQVLVEGQAYENLVNVLPSNDAARAAGFRRVVPNDPDQSFLLIKLIGGPSFDPRYGSPMPLTGSPLSSADIEQIRAWIVAGAPAPESATPTPTASPTPSIAAAEEALPTATPIAPAG